MRKSIYYRHRLCLLAGIVCIMLLPAAQFSGYSYAADEGPDEFTLDLGPQGKEKNRDLYGYGTASFDKHIGAGEWGSWELTYHVGRMGVDDGGRIFLLFHVTADWGLFQAGDPHGANYVSARTTGRAKDLVIDINRRHAGPRPYWSGLVITVREGDLKMGDKVIVTLGDRSSGGPGDRRYRVSSGFTRSRNVHLTY